MTALALGVILPHMALHTWRLVNPETVDVVELRGAGTGSHQVGGVSSAGGLALWSALAISLVPALWVYPVAVAVGILMTRPRRLLLGSPSCIRAATGHFAVDSSADNRAWAHGDQG